MSTDKAPENENTNSNNNGKQLSLFLALTKSLISNDPKKKIQRKNLCSEITSTIMNKPKFASFLKMNNNLSIKEQLSSIHFSVCQRDIELLQHRDKEIHILQNHYCIN